MTVVGKEYSSEFEKDIVISQDPGKDRKVKELIDDTIKNIRG